MNNSEVRREIPGLGVQSLEKVLNLNRLSQVGHILRMPTKRMPCFMLFFDAGNDWEMVQSDRSITWHKCMKNLFSGLIRADPIRLPG